MIGYSTVGTNDIDTAAAFYDALFATLGAKRQFDSKTFIAWGRDMNSPAFAVAKPYDGNASTVGNGVIVALVMSNTEQVDALYAKALELGGSDEGPPGDRGDSFYAAYFRDPDGNKLNAFCWNRG